MPLTPPPPALGCARVIEYAVLDESVGYTGRPTIFVGDEELGRVQRLAICDDKKSSRVLLLHCDEDWDARAISGFETVSEAKNHAERRYPGVSAQWIDAHVSEEEAERHLDEMFGDNRCSFCGKRADQIHSSTN